MPAQHRANTYNAQSGHECSWQAHELSKTDGPSYHLAIAVKAHQTSQLSWPQSEMTTGLAVLPDCEPTPSIFFTTSMPSTTLPKTTCLPSNQAVFTVHKKNCEPFVFGPAFAMDRMPEPVCFSVKHSSANFMP